MIVILMCLFVFFYWSQIYVPTNPRGAEPLSPGIVASQSDFYQHRLWGQPSEVLVNYSEKKVVIWMHFLSWQKAITCNNLLIASLSFYRAAPIML